jgi:hypothetical protein
VCSFCATLRRIVVAVEICAAKVLHATQLKFHARRIHNTPIKALSHLATQIDGRLRFGTLLALHKCKQAVKFLPGGFS